MQVDTTRHLLQAFDFQTLFREQLGWGNPVKAKPEAASAKDTPYTRQEIAHLGGASVYEITTPEGTIPDKSVRAQISADMQKVQLVHILIFIDQNRTQCVWRWLKRDGRKDVPREHFYLKGQPGDLFLAKLRPLFVDISQLNEQGSIGILDVSRKIEKALDVKPVTKKFYRDYQQQHVQFLELITGIDDEADRRWYASVLLNRLMFIYFLQKKQFLDKGDVMYLGTKLTDVQKQHGEGQYYSLFLQKLFFAGFAIPESERDAETKKLIGQVKYLNGGLFLKHKIELEYDGAIHIPDVAFANLFALFDSYSWTLNDTPGDPDNEINPDVLGYIFEKYINQKAFGAYYTPPEITDYLCEQTVYKLILDEVNGPELSAEVPEKLAQQLRRKRYADVPELLINLDADTCRRLVVGPNAILPNLSLLDPSCGSGAFLVAAMKTLINIYAGVLGKMQFLNDKGLTDWKAQIDREHPSINYYIKKQIITNNLYGVDLMEEATEIAKLRLFLTLVASAEKVSQLEPLPNIDFNIMSGNSLIGLLRVDNAQFANYDLFSKNYSTLVQEKGAAVRAYKHAATFTKDLQSLRESIDTQRHEAIETLNTITLYEWGKLGIKYEQATWDEKENAIGKSLKRSLKKSDIERLHPFHWSFEFDDIMVNRGGFDAIITNPPWEVFKPNAKEFFMKYSELISKKKMPNQDFEKAQEELMKDPDVRQARLEYLSSYRYVSQYYRNAPQYINQISYANGKKVGSDTNLYKLFTEQCYNLLKPGGYCGIVVQSSMYSDLGTKQLRQLLFSNATISQLISLSNEKFIFDNVDHRVKFCFLSFQKGGETKQFQATFRINPREAIAVGQLESFLHDPSQLFTITTAFIEHQSPDSLAIKEVNNETEFSIANKVSRFPLLGSIDLDSWKVEFTREVNNSSDYQYIKEDKDDGYLALYEGKTIHQYNHQYNTPRYYIELEKFNVENSKTYKDLYPSNFYRLCFRRQARGSDKYTFIGTVAPKNSLLFDNLAYAKPFNENGLLLSNHKTLVLTSLLNSYCFQYLLRQNLGQNLSFFLLYEISVPHLQATDKWFVDLMERTAKLICTAPEFADLWNEVMSTPWAANSGATNETERNQLRAEIDAIVATLYGLTETEFTYILTTFPLVAETQKQTTLTEFNKLQAMQPATVFLSYAKEDKVQVEQLHQDLTAKGFQVWRDENQLLPGENWQHNIEQAMKKHEFVIICLSGVSVAKRGFVQAEWKQALQKQALRPISDVYIIPVKLNQFDDSNLPAEINALQYVDLSKDWTGGVDAVVRAVEKYRR